MLNEGGLTPGALINGKNISGFNMDLDLPLPPFSLFETNPRVKKSLGTISD